MRYATDGIYGFQYCVLSEYDKTCEITGYEGSNPFLNIPSQLDGYTVTSIGDYAFENNKSLDMVTISEGITIIKQYAFKGCISLTDVIIPNSVTSIGTAAFEHCVSLGNAVIPNSVTYMGGMVFWCCNSLESVSIGKGVRSLNKYAFFDCDNLTRLYVSVNTEIEKDVLEELARLPNLTIEYEMN